jgi:hypothetical protein
MSNPLQAAYDGGNPFSRIPNLGRLLGIVMIKGPGPRRIAAVYGINARSEGRGGSHNRRLIVDDDGNIVARFAIKPKGIEHPENYEYTAMMCDGIDAVFVANGDHITEMAGGYSNEVWQLFGKRTYENDGYTPRIGLIINSDMEGFSRDGWDGQDAPLARFVMIRKAPGIDMKETSTQDVLDITPGSGRFYHTYDNPASPGGQPVPYCGAPHLIAVESDTAESIALNVWNLLAPQNGLLDHRIALAVRIYPLINSLNDEELPKEPEEFILNRYSDKDPGPDSDVLIEEDWYRDQALALGLASLPPDRSGGLPPGVETSMGGLFEIIG